jgi:hypothetical protein
MVANTHGTLCMFGISVAGWMLDDMYWTRNIPPEKFLFLALLLVVTWYSGTKWLAAKSGTTQG